VEYGEVARIGSSRAIRVDVRIVGATNEHLPSLVEAGRFRADLLDRLSFEVVTLPPLRHREGDVPLLVDHFGRRMALELGWERWPGFAPGAMATLAGHDWPGNVRELRNVVERAVYRWAEPGRPIDSVEFDPFASPWRPAGVAARPAMTAEPGPAAPVAVVGEGEVVSDLRAACEAYERRLLEAALKRCRYNQRTTATALALTYDQLRHALRRHNLLERAGAG
jgi:psp operon transcriptional activator